MKEASDAMVPGCIVENRHITCFDALSEEEKEILNEHTVDIMYKKGEVIAKQGSFASHVIFLKAGLVKVYLEGAGKEVILEIVPSERLLTLSSLYEGNSTFLHSAATYIDSTASLMEAKIFMQLMRTNSHFAAKVINILNESTAQLYGRFYALTCKQSHGRLADILLCLSKRIYKSLKFDLSLGRNDLADLTGLSSESVIRILKEFKDDNLIDFKGKSMEILNPKSLEKISQYG